MFYIRWSDRTDPRVSSVAFVEDQFKVTPSPRWIKVWDACSVTVGRAPVVVESGPTIAVEQRPAFRDYVVEQRVPAFRIPDRVVVGATLPESGVTYYDVPQRFGATTYRYTVVNGETVLVEPRSRRIVEVMD